MRTVWKFPLAIVNRQSIKIPTTNEFLCVQMQRGIPCIWAKVDPYSIETFIWVVIHETEHDVSDTEDMTYLGSFQTADGNVIFHVWAE